jgi:uncharacterized protein (DUF302 family)
MNDPALERTAYGFTRTVPFPPDEAEARLREALSRVGFGILTEIDVRETLKAKLDVDFRPYRILGACNPPLAHRALTAEEQVGLLLPCNVIVYAGDAEGTSVVAALDPVKQLAASGNPALEALARDAEARLEEALRAV